MGRNFAAISTAAGNAALGIVRICGDRAIEIANSVFDGADLVKAAGNTVSYGKIIRNKEVVDFVTATVFRAPKSPTGLDMVEFCGHGGVVVLSMILQTLLEAGAEPAEAGEFSKTAFLNGKLDMAECESVIDLINAKSEAAAKIAAKGTELSKKINEIRDTLISALSSIFAAVDFTYEDIPEPDGGEILKAVKKTSIEIEQLLSTYDFGRAVSKGIDTVIAGIPNVGKSSVMNMLSGETRSIVTEISGTTRDVVTKDIVIDDIILSLSDTAGIRESGDEIEKIGISLAKEKFENAELLLLIFDGSKELSGEEKDLLKKAESKNAVVVLNKSDAGLKADLPGAIVVSAKTGAGLPELKAAIKAKAGADFREGLIITNARHFAALSRAKISLLAAADALSQGEHPDIAEIDITAAADALGEITGKTAREDVVADIFARFCVGK